MGKDVQQPGGVTEKENTVTGLARQLRIDTERNTIRLHDAIKQGGHEIPNLELVEALLLTGGEDRANNVIQMFNSIAELKGAQPALNVFAILREDGIEDTFIWKAGVGDSGDIASDISGHWARLSNEVSMAIGLWRAGMINMQIGGTEPLVDQTITAWLQANQLKLWDGTDYLDPTPVLWMKLFAAIGGYYTGAASLPDRLNAQSFEIANLDTVVESGWYKSAAAATGAPVVGVHSFEHRELTSAIAIQIFYPHNSTTRNYWIRYRTAVTPTWTSWIEVAGALPARLAATSTATSADLNTLIETGFYFANSDSPNLPVAYSSSVMVVRASAILITQLVLAASGTLYQRIMAAGVWGSWLALSVNGHTHDDRYYTETEMNALLVAKAAVVHNHDDRYYTESEVNSLISGRAPSSVLDYNGIGSYVHVLSSDFSNVSSDGLTGTLAGRPGTWRQHGIQVVQGGGGGVGALFQRIA